MRRFVLFALLGAALVVLAAPQNAQAWGRGYCGGYYAPAYYYYPQSCYMPAYYYCPPTYYYAPSYYSYPSYTRPSGTVVEVAAIDGKGFEPKAITVRPGTTVRWVNRGKERHTVTSRSGRFDSGPIPPGGSFTVMFVTPGTHDYFCRPHEKMGMVGSVTVKEGASSGSGGSGSSGY